MANVDNMILAASKKHPIVPLAADKTYTYGTAGFRMKASLLEGVAFRVGLLAALRSRKQGGLAIGVMMTASHNPAADNGVKILDPMGEMLEQSWEKLATMLVNVSAGEELLKCYHKMATDQSIDLASPAKVIFGRDTRPSGHTLAKALSDALHATESTAVDYKILTTPQLHYLTRATNTEGTLSSYGEVSEAGYYKKLTGAFLRAMDDKTIDGPLTVDCANGVGGPKLYELLKYLPKDQLVLKVKLVNDDVLRPELLNFNCGADFVKTKQRPPPLPRPVPGARCCSFDGDVDRLIFYHTDPAIGFVMLDGDRIACLATSFITELLESAGLSGVFLSDRRSQEDELRVGVVQTAYANGASTHYLRQHLRVPVVCTPTGVKYLHRAAASFDVGVYFEANGHGTVLFSPHASRTFRQHEPQSPAQRDALNLLASLSDLANQTVGDALSDMLLVEIMLAHRRWTLCEWAAMYKDLPNRQLKVEVADKDAFVTMDAECRLARPVGIQYEIDAMVAKYKDARAFARASGTENVCRVYAEAATHSEAEKLAQNIANLISIYGKQPPSS